jgi:hypothetical protein
VERGARRGETGEVVSHGNRWAASSTFLVVSTRPAFGSPCLPRPLARLLLAPSKTCSFCSGAAADLLLWRSSVSLAVCWYRRRRPPPLSSHPSDCVARRQWQFFHACCPFSKVRVFPSAAAFGRHFSIPFGNFLLLSVRLMH